MEKDLILTLDAGTTASKCTIFRKDGTGKAFADGATISPYTLQSCPPLVLIFTLPGPGR